MAGRLVNIFEYETLMRVGELQVDVQSGRLVSVSGSEALKIWGEENLRDGLVEEHSYYHNGHYDLVTAPVPPEDSEFTRYLNRRLMRRGWCEEGMMKAIRDLPNFSNHPWRLAHRS